MARLLRLPVVSNRKINSNKRLEYSQCSRLCIFVTVLHTLGVCSVCMTNALGTIGFAVACKGWNLLTDN